MDSKQISSGRGPRHHGQQDRGPRGRGRAAAAAVGGVIALLAAVLAGCASARPDHADRPISIAAEPPMPAVLADAIAEGELVPEISEQVDRNIIFGIPQTATPVQILWNVGYTVGYCQQTRTPLWVGYRLFADPPFTPGPRPTRFITDTRIADPVRHDDYNNTGYDRGHMAPNAPIARRYGDDAQRATFLTTNIVPQLPGLNQRGWEALETIISTDWAQRFGEVWVFVGPIFDGPCWQLAAGIRIPSHCYMIIVDIDEADGSVHALGVIMEQRRIDAEPLSDFIVTIADIEARTGIDFLHELDDLVEMTLEHSSPDPRWNIDQILTPAFPGAARPIVQQRCD